MKKQNIFFIALALIALMASSLACQAISGEPEADSSVGEENAPASADNEQVQPMDAPREVIRQWAVGASASSQFGDANWAPIQAAGTPDTPECGDQPSAWASASGNSVEWLEVFYEIAVVPQEINIIESYGSNQVTKVEVKDVDGNYHEVYSGSPAEMDCPYTLNIIISDANYEAAAIRISVDESFLLYWNEIDAVELVGESTGKSIATPVALFATPTAFPPPDGFLWRLGGEANPSDTTFWVPQGVDVSPDGLVYVADYKGIIVFDADGSQRNLIDSPEMETISDVAIGPDGNIYVAAWGNHQILVYTPGGEFLHNWGGEGMGAGVFGDFGPQRIAFGSDGNLYALDGNKNAAGDDIDRVQVFSKDGKYLREFTITESFFPPDDLVFGPDGNLYILSGFADYILVLTPDGTKVAHIGDEAISPISGKAITIDANGNIYVSGTSVVKLDSTGNLLDTFGVEITDGLRPWPEGGFYDAWGVGVTQNGDQVFVTDHSGDFAYLTAFSFK